MDIEINNTLKSIYDCLNKKKDFILDAGAGSGKTYSLVETIKYILKNEERSRIVCITYTNNAKDEVISRIIDSDKIIVSTIHDYIWSNISKYQKELRKQVNILIEEKIEEYKQENNVEKLEKYKLTDYECNISYRNYENLTKGIISHDTLLLIFKKMIKNTFFSNILFSSFDFIFIDEYQDTDSTFFYEFLDEYIKYKTKYNNIVMALFGDDKQHIFENGIGCILDDYKDFFEKIKKLENYRSCNKIVNINNCLRNDLKQISIVDDSSLGKIEFIYNCSDDKYLNNEIDYKNYKKIYLTHRQISKEVGFENIYEKYNIAFKSKGSTVIKNADERFLNYICNEIMPAIYLMKNGKSFMILQMINNFSITIKDLELLKINIDNILNNINQLTIIDFLNELFSLGVFSPIKFDRLYETYYDTDQVEFIDDVLKINAQEFYNYYKQFAGYTNLETMHGTKGNEFDFLIINIREKEPWNNYNFTKFFKNENMKDTVRQRTENIFYVACTRAKKSLVINYIIDNDDSKEESSINKMKENIKNIWEDNMIFTIKI